MPTPRPRRRASSVAIRRPGWTAGRGREQASPNEAAVASRSLLVNASPQNQAGESSPVASSGPTSSRIASPARIKAQRSRGAEAPHSHRTDHQGLAACRRGESRLDPRAQLTADPQLGQLDQELRPMLGLRPWFAFLRRELTFFLLVRFDIGLRL